MAIITTTTTTSILTKDELTQKFGAMVLDSLTSPVSVILAAMVVLLLVAIIFLWRYIQAKDKVLIAKDVLNEKLMDKTFDTAKVLNELATLIKTLVYKGRG